MYILNENKFRSFGSCPIMVMSRIDGRTKMGMRNWYVNCGLSDSMFNIVVFLVYLDVNTIIIIMYSKHLWIVYHFLCTYIHFVRTD